MTIFAISYTKCLNHRLLNAWILSKFFNFSLISNQTNQKKLLIPPSARKHQRQTNYKPSSSSPSPLIINTLSTPNLAKLKIPSEELMVDPNAIKLWPDKASPTANGRSAFVSWITATTMKMWLLVFWLKKEERSQWVETLINPML